MLRSKMLAILLPPLLVVIAVLILFSQQRMQSMALQNAYAEAENILLREAQPFAETLNRAYSTAKALAVDMAEIHKSGGLPREFLADSLKRQMREAKVYSGIWTMWEKNAYDGKDAGTTQGDFATESGAVNILWTWKNGQLVAVPGDDSMFDDAYYLSAREGRKIDLPEVYYNDSMGEYISSVVAPIIEGERFLGAVGVDQTLRAIQDRMATVKPYGSGYAMLFGPDGTVLSAPNQKLIGKPLPESLPWDVKSVILGKGHLRTRVASPFTGEDMLTVYRHIPVADGSTSWCLSVSVPTSKILADSIMAVRIMLGVGVLGFILTVVVVVLVVSSVVHALRQGVDYARTVADGNLDSIYEPNRSDEIGILAKALSSMVQRMRVALADAESQTVKAENEAAKVEKALAETAKRAKVEEAQRLGMLAVAADLEKIVASLGAAANSLAGQVHRAVDGAAETQAHSEKSVSSIRDMDHATGVTANNAAATVSLVEQARSEAANGTRVMGEMVTAVSQINVTSQQLKRSLANLGVQVEGISGIMNTISEIADQTNLLSLNAAIEAARAGESGRGFAVVADAVRRLAERTMQATGEVSKVVTSIQAGTASTIQDMDKAVKMVEISTALAEKTGATLTEIESLVTRSANQVNTITDASKEQVRIADTIRSISEIVTSIAAETVTAMKVSSDTVSQLTATSEKLSELTALLRK